MKAPEHWFFVLAKSPEEAIDIIDGEWGEADARSLRRLDGPIAFQFKTRLQTPEDDDPYVECEPDEPHMTLGDNAGYDGAHDWIRERMMTPFGGPANEDYRAMDASLGEKMSKEWKRAVHEPTRPKNVDVGSSKSKKGSRKRS